MVVSWCAFAGCSGEDPGVAVDPGCNAGTYPAAPDGAASLLHVSAACPAELADGTAGHPYTTITEALTKATPGAAILVAPGTYTENLTISQDVAVIGTSNVTSPSAADVVINAPAEHAILVTKGEKVTLQGLRVASATGTGILVQGASVTVDGCAVENTKVGGGGVVGSGAGVVSTGDGSIILQNSAITGAAGMGIYVGSAKAIILQSTIRGSGGPGIRLDKTTDQVRIEGSTIEENTQMGIGVFSSRAIILQSVVKNTKVDAGSIGDGVVVASTADAAMKPSDIEMSDTEITGNARVGLLCAGGTRAIILQNNTIQGNGLPATFGAGIWIQGGAGGVEGNLIDGNTISGNKFVGLGMTGDTHGIILQNNMVTGTVLGSTFLGVETIDVGDGIGVFKGASAKLLGNTVQANARIGLILDEASGATTVIQKNTFQDNDQYGIILQNQAMAPDTSDNTFKGNVLGDTSSVSAGTFGVRVDGFSVN
jgi:parallel beta-helix repeat protein